MDILEFAMLLFCATSCITRTYFGIRNIDGQVKSPIDCQCCISQTCSLSCCCLLVSLLFFFLHKKFAVVGRRTLPLAKIRVASRILCMFGQKPKQCTISPLMWLWLCLCAPFVVLAFDRAQFSMYTLWTHAHSLQWKWQQQHSLNYFCTKCCWPLMKEVNKSSHRN